MTKVAALLMAAGNSRRMGGPNKLLLPFKNKMLLEFGVEAILHAKFSNRIMITGRDHDQTGRLGLDCGFTVIHNPSYEGGFGTSLAAGFRVLLNQPEINGALVMLGDMPLLTSAHLGQLITGFDAANGLAIIRAASNSQPGNPVIIPKTLFSEMAKLGGGQSGQAIINASGITVRLVDIGPAALADVDTPEALAALQGAVL